MLRTDSQPCPTCQDLSILDRRELLRGASAAALISALHPDTLWGRMPEASGQSGVEPLITGLGLLTAASLDEMQTFYRERLGFSVLERSPSLLTVLGGQTPITFVRAEPEQGEPWYHVAFNIPENKIVSALEWQKKRSPVVPTPSRLIDPDYPDEVRHFRNWNAHSVFFFDPAGNLLEYIARHDLDNGAPGPFSSDDILYASEIGLVVDDQAESAKQLHRALELPVYPSDTSRWWAMGDEAGLLLCLPKRQWGENTSTPKRFSVYPTEASIRGLAGPKKYSLPGYPYRIAAL